MSSHPQCGETHICQKPSGHTCIIKGCNEKAGTFWGIFWCPSHDKERLDRIEKALAADYMPSKVVKAEPAKHTEATETFGLFGDQNEQQKTQAKKKAATRVQNSQTKQ